MIVKGLTILVNSIAAILLLLAVGFFIAAFGGVIALGWLIKTWLLS